MVRAQVQVQLCILGSKISTYKLTFCITVYLFVAGAIITVKS